MIDSGRLGLPGIGFIAAALVLFCIHRLSVRARAKFPPGPRGLPLLGNALNIPLQQPWLTYARWGEIWGPLTSISVFGKRIIIINDVKLATDMLNKANFSDRPTFHMAALCGHDADIPFLPYNDRLRNSRRLIHQLIGNPPKADKFVPIEEEAIRDLLKRLSQKPEDWSHHIRHAIGAITFRASYGQDINELDGPFAELAERVINTFCDIGMPGNYLVNLFPALRYVPGWFPGAEFKRKAKVWKSELLEMIEKPYLMVKQALVAGTAEWSFVSSQLDGKNPDKDEEHDIRWVAGVIYAGGVDTSCSVVYWFVLAMVLHPEVQRKAQEEIDSVVGDDRLPTYSDREHLPYINALTKEVFRWSVTAPLGAPHSAIQDEFYEGYYIEKGSWLVPNIWKFLNDPATYPDPRRFDPERFLGPNPQPDPREVCFGFGRRLCPGIHLADATVFIACLMSLAAFRFDKKVENGVVIEPVEEPTSTVISNPAPFECTIKPRSSKIMSLINS